MTHKIFFDGGSALNIVCCYDENRGEYFTKVLEKPSTNNELEYEALLYAVTYANMYYGTTKNVMFCGDSALIIKQMQGEYVVRKHHLKVIKTELDKELRKTPTGHKAEFKWVPRLENKAGIVLDELLNKKRRESQHA